MERRRNARCNTIERRRNAAGTGNYKHKENTALFDMVFQEATHNIIGIAMDSKENCAKQLYHDASKHHIRNATCGDGMQQERRVNSWYKMRFRLKKTNEKH